MYIKLAIFCGSIVLSTFSYSASITEENGDGIPISKESNGSFYHGTPEDDDILVDTGDNRVFGNGGNDYLQVGRGNDLILGGEGNDDILAAGGKNRIFGGKGSDSIIGGEGNDHLSGMEFRVPRGKRNSDITEIDFDKLFGGRGNDTFYRSYSIGYNRSFEIWDGQEGVDRYSVLYLNVGEGQEELIPSLSGNTIVIELPERNDLIEIMSSPTIKKNNITYGTFELEAPNGDEIIVTGIEIRAQYNNYIYVNSDDDFKYGEISSNTVILSTNPKFIGDDLPRQ